MQNTSLLMTFGEVEWEGLVLWQALLQAIQEVSRKYDN